MIRLLYLISVGLRAVTVAMLFAAATALWAQSEDGDRKVALVVGNSAYTNFSFLQNPVGDATLIASKLESLGFEVLLRTDLDRQGFVRALTELRPMLLRSDTAAFYFAGHGVQVDGRNYLLPVDAALESRAFLSLEAIDVELITETLNLTAKTSLVFLDACRDDPFAPATRSASGGVTRGGVTRGLARVSAKKNTIISFAAAPGNVALDRVPGSDNPNSPFTTALARHLGTPGDTISRTMIKVRRDVLDATEGKQVPWEHSSLTDEVVLAALPPDEGNDGISDEEMWAWMEGTADPLVLERFVERFPNSQHVPKARERILALRKAEEAARSEAERQALEAERQRLAEEEAERQRIAFFKEPELPKIIGVMRDCPDCPEMVEIRGTDVLFGTPDTLLRAQPDERPARRISMGRAIAVARYETSQAEFDRFVKATGHKMSNICQITSDDDTLPRIGTRDEAARGADLPAICVSWEDAKAYTRWLSEKTGQIYRLPTEIEFEYLAEAFHFNMDMNQMLGDRSVCEIVNIADLGSPFSWRNFSCTDELGRGAFPVSSLQPDSFGLHHLMGNVWEWMENCYADTPEGAVARSLETDDLGCQSRSVRGGGWSDPLTSLRTSNRNWEAPDFRSDVIGFRVVRLP